jgi:hypothetical protein
MWRLLEFIDYLFNPKPTKNMPPQILTLAVFLVEELIKATPALAAEFQTLFASGTPTAADFAALRAKIAGESYAALVPASELPPEPNTPPEAQTPAPSQLATPPPTLPDEVNQTAAAPAPAPVIFSH